MRGKKFDSEIDLENATIDDLVSFLYAGKWRRQRRGWSRRYVNGEEYKHLDTRSAAKIHFRVVLSHMVNHD